MKHPCFCEFYELVAHLCLKLKKNPLFKQVNQVEQPKPRWFVIPQSSLGKSHKDVVMLVLHMLFTAVALRFCPLGEVSLAKSLLSESSPSSVTYADVSFLSAFLVPSLEPGERLTYTVLITVTLRKCAGYIGRISDYMKR